MVDNTSFEIIEFWNWFRTIADALFLNPTNTYLVNEIDSKISKLGRFDWEIGPWDEMYYLAMSPNLDKDKLALTREFIAHAPKCTNWCFFPSKPPKNDWQGIWKMQNEKGKSILIDANGWKYILYKFDDGTFDMDIQVDNIDGNNDTVNMAIDIALTGYLGEETFMNLVSNIQLVNDFEADHLDKATLVKYIKKHIESI